MDKYTVTEQDALEKLRLDAFSAKIFEISRARAQELISDGLLTVDGKTREKKYILSAGETVEIELPPEKELEAIPQNIPIDIVYEDEYLLVVDKPRGMVVHPAAGNPDGTLVNALLYHCKGRLSSINGVIRPGIVHRIDKDTSGLLIVAKTDDAHKGLAEQIAVHSFERKYEAIVGGHLREKSGTVSAPIGRHKTDRKKMAVYSSADTEGVREAVTHYKVLASNGGYSLVKFKLETGRTHQIRVHMASIGHPLLCDSVYGGGHTQYEKINQKRICGQALLAKELDFIHPDTGERVHFEVELPEYFKRTIKDLGLDDYETETGF